MPSPLKFFGADPNKLKRGRGLYYLRGNGYYSKYDPTVNGRDAKIKAKGWKKSIVGKLKKGQKSRIGGTNVAAIQHSTDGVLRF